MSAPLLTPLETPIFDEDVLAEMEANTDDVMCLVADAAAVAQLITTCCGTGYLTCERHLQAARRRAEVVAWVQCKRCQRTYTMPTFDEIYRVVPL